MYSYYNCWKTKNEKHNAVFQNIVKDNDQTRNAIKHKINVGDKPSHVRNETVASSFGYKFCIPLNFEILESGLPFYQYGLGSRLTHELTFADYSDVIKVEDKSLT